MISLKSIIQTAIWCGVLFCVEHGSCDSNDNCYLVWCLILSWLAILNCVALLVCLFMCEYLVLMSPLVFTDMGLCECRYVHGF